MVKVKDLVEKYGNRDYFKRLRSYINQLENDYDIVCAFAWKQYKKGNF